jgi:hypothetical protein
VRQHREIEVLMDEAHRWLAARNLKQVVSCLRSLPDAAPPEAAAVSDVAVIWALTAWHFVADRPTGKQLLAVAWPDPKDSNSPTWRPTQFADRLALHLSIEQVILDLAPTVGEVSKARVNGGLRRPEVLRAAAAIGSDPNGPWSELRPLLLASPLTVLVYGDLCAPDQDAADTARLALQFDLPDSDAEWHARWLTLLARSMTGTILSPLQAEEPITAAEVRLAELRREEPPRIERIGGWWSRSQRNAEAAHGLWQAKVLAAEKLLKNLQGERKTQCFARLRFLSEFLAVAAADLGEPAADGFPHVNQPRLAAGYFIARTWDMVIRSLLARQTPGILRVWPGIVAAGLQAEWARDALVVGVRETGEDPSKLGRVVPSELAREVLSELTLLPFAEISKGQETEWSRDARMRFFNVGLVSHPEAMDKDESLPPGTTLDELALAARVTRADMAHACDRIGGGGDAVRVALPVPPPDRLDRPPAAYLGPWGRCVIPPQTPEQEVKVHTTQVPDDEEGANPTQPEETYDISE